MPESSAQSAIINDVLLLYELSLAIGSSLDARKNCEGFLNILQARKNITQVAVWILTDADHADGSPQLSLLYANPRRSTPVAGRERTPPLLRTMHERRPVTISSPEMDDERLAGDGLFVLFPLAEFGVLELYFPSRHATIPPRTVNQLKNVIDKFAASLAGSLAHERLQHTEALLRQSENRYRMLIENLPQRFFIKDTSSNFVAISHNLASDLGIQPDEVSGKNDFDFFPAELAKKFQMDDQRVMQQGKPEEIEERVIVRGEERIIQTIKAPALDRDGNIAGVLGMFWDISEQKKDREQIARLVASVEHAQDAIIISDQEARIQYVNPAFEQMTGYAASDAVGQFTRILRSNKHPEAFYKHMLDTVQQGNIWRGEMIIQCRDGSLRHVERNIAPVFDDAGEVICHVTIQRDITEHKQMEEKFLHAQKMESLGILVGGVAHEFNNALAGITGRLYLLKRKLTASATALNDVEIAEELCFRSADMVKKMLAFARKSPLQMHDFDLGSFIRETFRLHRLSIPESITVHTMFEADTMVIHGDTSQVQQIIINLLNNARDAVEGVDNPEITLSLAHFVPDATFIQAHPDTADRHFARISVDDNGHGIHPSDLPHIFDPFYTTKEVGKGTGLGLAMVYGACGMHEGYVDVTSQPGKGTRMEICLPLIDTPDHTLESAPLPATARGHGELILLVDDEEMLRETLKEVLLSLGYRVLEASDGEQAMQLFSSHHHELALVLMDVVMPRMGGVEAGRLMQAMQPDVPVIFCTGYDKHDVMADENIADDMTVSKPYNIELISQQIARHIRKPFTSG
ncbi:PAS domain S-box protein [Mariprofundus erugo]|uniref:histidine kinase n=1 Tax=Mariprofundus erugo TaxID=2528639 RepID=A0A5R9GNK3_9PROT|nr:PAS domain S-box protein [Mariprofundus erugo]TLS66519.1 PAS domain S-box protein [Mariprofundus erugo]